MHDQVESIYLRHLQPSEPQQPSIQKQAKQLRTQWLRLQIWRAGNWSMVGLQNIHLLLEWTGFYIWINLKNSLPIEIRINRKSILCMWKSWRLWRYKSKQWWIIWMSHLAIRSWTWRSFIRKTRRLALLILILVFHSSIIKSHIKHRFITLAVFNILNNDVYYS